MKQWATWGLTICIYIGFVIEYCFGEKANRTEFSLFVIVLLLFVIALNTNRIKD